MKKHENKTTRKHMMTFPFFLWWFLLMMAIKFVVMSEDVSTLGVEKIFSRWQFTVAVLEPNPPPPFLS